jgi:hypothetical protein
MRLTLDSSQVRGCIALWREALAHKGRARGPLAQVMLARVTATVTGWSDLLALCRADQGEDEALERLRAEVEGFKVWIDEAALATKLAEDLQHLDESGPAPRAPRTQRRVDAG